MGAAARRASTAASQRHAISGRRRQNILRADARGVGA